MKVTDKRAAQDDADVQAAVKAVAEALGDTGRILVRESGTEPLVRVMVEAPEHETCEKYVAQVVDVIRPRATRSDFSRIRAIPHNSKCRYGEARHGSC